MPGLPIPWSKLQGCLFDIDGTLTHSDDLHYKAFVELLPATGFNASQRHASWGWTKRSATAGDAGPWLSPSVPLKGADGKPISREFFDQNVAGRHNPEIAKEFFPDWSEEDRTKFMEKKEAFFRESAGDELVALPGLRELIDEIDKSGKKRIAVTNAPRANAELMLEAIGLADRFNNVIVGAECPNAKPHPDPYLIGMDKIGIKAEGALVFEDSPSGIKAGVAAGATVIGVATTQSAETLKEAGASAVVSDYTEVLAMLQEETVKN